MIFLVPNREAVLRAELARMADDIARIDANAGDWTEFNKMVARHQEAELKSKMGLKLPNLPQEY